MRDRIAAPLVALVLTLSLAPPVAAGQFEDGEAAYDRGDYAHALRLWRPLVDQGNPTAQTMLGTMYGSGRGVPQDYAEALKWFRKAADQDNAAAQAALGIMYTNGHGVPQDYAEALKWFRKAADQGDDTAQADLGIIYANAHGVPQDYAEALKWFRKAADQGNADAQLKLGFMYGTGRGVPKDYAKAAMWLHKAVDQGDAQAHSILSRIPISAEEVATTRREFAQAQSILGTMYAEGRGVSQDYAEAARWYRNAAEQGDPTAQRHLGVMYTEGRGVLQDYVQAHKWFNLAVSRFPASDSEERGKAADARDLVAAKMTPKQITEAQKLAREWKPK